MIERSSAVGSASTATPSTSSEPAGPKSTGPRSNATRGASVDAVERARTLEAFVGTWKKVSGEGPETLEITASAASVRVASERHGYEHVESFDRINSGPERSRPWRGNFLAPGGLVVTETATTFADGKLERVSRRNEKPGLFGLYVQTELREVRALELSGGKLTFVETAGMYNRSGLWFGEFTKPVQFNTSNIASFFSGTGRSEYVRAG